jgi:hypothetical protein
MGTEVLVSADPEGSQWLGTFDQQTIKKGNAFLNVFGKEAYVHYPLKTSMQYFIELSSETLKPEVLRLVEPFRSKNYRFPSGMSLIDLQHATHSTYLC